MRWTRLAPGLTLAVLVAPLAFGLAFTALPAFGYLPALGGHVVSLRYFAAFFTMPGIVRSIALALGIGLATGGISFLLVVLFVAGWAGTPAFARLQRGLSPLLAVPHAAAAFGLAFLVAPSGFLMRLASPWLTGLTRPPDWLIVHDPLGITMTVGMIVKEAPFLFLVSLAALPQLKLVETRRLAASLGYGRIAGFAYLLAPALYGQIRLAVFAVIAYSASVVDVAAILGPTLPAPLPVRLLSWMNEANLSMRFVASAGALVQFALVLAALALWLAGERLVGGGSALLRACGVRFRRDRWLRFLSFGLVVLCAAAVFTGLALLALWSLAGLWQFPDALPQVFWLKTWQRQLSEIAAPFATTLVTALVATAIALALTVACLAREDETGRTGGRRALLLVYLPLLVPQISFVFGLQVLSLLTGIDASLAGLVFVHLIFVLPYVFLSLSDPWRAFDPRYAVVASGLGLSRGAIFRRVRLPMLARAVLTAAAVGFAVSVAQYLPTVLIGAGRLTTITTEAVALASGGNARVIGVYAFLQAILPFLGFAIASLVPALLFRNRRALRT
ncbi:ABC transporter permease [Pararhizobium mangrovi]|uniref:ABC transporter permease subunit n=1 Tax=Pararhizobium mangrovi TaxID=2590452 RepID=A0A506U4W4_9HYPH|nr:ABC transporter permease subunit [Pararhizobium mangrovi]TPW28396.1 ABC transporter permease subunit [Pararhizobium mangrovi]